MRLLWPCGRPAALRTRRAATRSGRRCSATAGGRARPGAGRPQARDVLLIGSALDGGGGTPTPRRCSPGSAGRGQHVACRRGSGPRKRAACDAVDSGAAAAGSGHGGAWVAPGLGETSDGPGGWVDDAGAEHRPGGAAARRAADDGVFSRFSRLVRCGTAASSGVELVDARVASLASDCNNSGASGSLAPRSPGDGVQVWAAWPMRTPAGASARGWSAAGRAHQAVPTWRPRLQAVGRPDAGGPTHTDVVVLDGTRMCASARRLVVSCNVVLAITGRDGPLRRRRADRAPRPGARAGRR